MGSVDAFRYFTLDGTLKRIMSHSHKIRIKTKAHILSSCQQYQKCQIREKNQINLLDTCLKRMRWDEIESAANECTTTRK